MHMRHLLSIIFAAALMGASGNISAGDRAFVQAALKSGIAEVQRAAVQANSADYRVRQYAGRMTTDHQAANQQLAAIASDIGVDTGSAQPIQPQPATTPGNGRPNAPSGGKALPPAAYFSVEVRAHQHAIALFSRQASGGHNPKLSAFAKQTLTTLKAHLQLAQTYLRQEQQLRR
jgi:putative membrane protein